MKYFALACALSAAAAMTIKNIEINITTSDDDEFDNDVEDYVFEEPVYEPVYVPEPAPEPMIELQVSTIRDLVNAATGGKGIGSEWQSLIDRTNTSGW